MKNRILFPLFALISSTMHGCSSEQGYPIDDYDGIPDLLAYHNVPGVSIAIIRDYKIDQLLVYGVKNNETLARVVPDTQFQAASISKSVTAVAAMTMAQNGSVNLDEDINNELVSWRLEANEHTGDENVNVRRLLSHTAGTTVHGFAGYNRSETVPSLVDILNGQAPANSDAIFVDITPGSHFRYSGGGYTVAQQLLMDVTQQSFEDVMNATVLEPLAMTNSSFNQNLSEDERASQSAGHDDRGKNIPGDYNRYPEMAAAGLWTTAEDLAKLLIELQLSLENQSNRVMAGEWVEEMITPVGAALPGTDDLFYGLGFFIERKDDKVSFGHGGTNAGFNSQMMADNSGSGYVVMTNGDNGGAVIDEIISLITEPETQTAFP